MTGIVTAIYSQLLPAWFYDAGPDKEFFDTYRRSVAKLRITPDQADVTLAVSERMYDAEASRRDTISNSSATLLSTGGILGALVVAAGQLGLNLNTGDPGVTTWIVLIGFLMSLAYIGAAIVMALAIQVATQGSSIDPSDLPPKTDYERTDAGTHATRLAQVHLEYTIQNYEHNNILKYRLVSAQRCLRNGIIAVLAAGMLSPWALHG